MNNASSESSAGSLRRLKYCAIAISALMVAGIVALMILSRGKGEDITGIVAPALLITIISGVAAIVAAVLQKRAEKAIDIKKGLP
jgi:spore maturation protein SpmA